MVTYPRGWTEECLENITSSIITGGTPSTTNPSFWGGTIPWLASTEIHQKRITKPTTYITDVGLRNSSAKVAPKYSVLIALAGQGKTRGTAAFLQLDMAVNQSLAALVVNEKADAQFLFYVIETNYTSLREVSSGDGGRGGLNKKLLKKYVISLPTDVLEQKAIAETLSCIDNHITNLTELIEKKKAIRDGALEDLVSGRTRLEGFFVEWNTMLLSKFTDVNPRTDIPDSFVYVDLESVKGISLVGQRRENKHSAPSRARRLAQKGDVFFQTVRPYQKNNYLFNLDGNYVFSTGYAQLRTNNDPNYLFLLIRQDSFVNRVLDNCTGTSYPAINPKKLSEIEVYVPIDIEEQKAIAQIIVVMDTEIASLEEEKDKMLQIKAGAMDDLLTGRIRLTRQGG